MAFAVRLRLVCFCRCSSFIDQPPISYLAVCTPGRDLFVRRHQRSPLPNEEQAIDSSK
jgi:hypothetical protein